LSPGLSVEVGIRIEIGLLSAILHNDQNIGLSLIRVTFSRISNRFLIQQLKAAVQIRVGLYVQMMIQLDRAGDGTIDGCTCICCGGCGVNQLLI